ncbi:nucleotide-binding universal stress UspA family protein [Glaciihabitans tibetensis]|uniref:Nucleotide-binding universal stress UspA family protein n=1 Tax=Glaciihabitans tibetensis TaxID=1266600 RepID=A0A2T0V6Y3_9MICO|nr:universal stress protein [Glaciihabitans tibetensis]PRY65952.1 nucleotide-binding universal stress UspA family protein [Glaciihabitans tibetensis]
MTRVPNYVVAYEATPQGRDALELGTAMARLTRAELRICLVLQRAGGVPAKIYATSSDFEALLAKQAEQWLADALALVPTDVTATTHLLWADSTSEGLIQAVADLESDRLVVGAARGGILNRFTIGSVANALLHASPVPVALAPRGYKAGVQLTRITCALGTRTGWEALLDSLAAFTEGLTIDLRFVTLVEVDAAHEKHSAVADSAAHLDTVLTYHQRHARGGGVITTEVGTGTGVEAAVEALDWRPDEIAFVGSSRLAAPNRIFLGVTAHRMLHALPVPLVVVPATPARS